MNQLHVALGAHTFTPELVSKASIKKHFETGWLLARTKTIEGNGLTGDIVVAAIMNMESRTRAKIMTTDQYNQLCNLAMAAQANLSASYSYDMRCQVLHARLMEAHRNRTGSPYTEAF